MPGATRTMVLWCPDWPVTAALREYALPAHTPLALLDRGEVFACSPAARQEGVHRGLRLREAQARCPGLDTRHYDPALDERIFEPAIAAVEHIMPGVQLIRPGLCALRAAGPARYYGGEGQAAAVLLERVSALGIAGAAVGIADAPFAAEQAARTTSGTGRLRIVEPGGSPAFLHHFPLDVLSRPRLAVLLRRLGITTLGGFAALDAADVRNRFGADGAVAHRMAAGLDHHGIIPRTPPQQLDTAVDFEPPLTRIDELTFAFRTAAERFTAELRQADLVCTRLLVRVQSESGELSERCWGHPRWFDADDVLDRVRWQLQGSGSVDHGLTAGITRLQVAPEAVEDVSDHADGLWGGGPDEQIHHGLARVQSMLGHGAVLTAALTGGRLLVDRTVFIPWGDPPSGETGTAVKKLSRPWPGKLPGPAPATVFDPPRPVLVRNARGASVDVDERGMLTGPPERFSTPDAAESTRKAAGKSWRAVKSWAGPWPVDERWWDRTGRKVHRFQLVDDGGAAWLLLLEDHQWWAEASYD
jgi:protein ImuB